MKLHNDVEFFKRDMFGESVSAVFSPCGKYRYILSKTWSDDPKVMFIGLNPSTATHEKPDNTIIKVGKLARASGYGSFYMLNLFAWISAYPKDLLTIEDPIKNNMHYLDYIGKHVKDVVFCWGAFKEAEAQAEKIKQMFPRAFALHINNNGSPKHPLYCRDDSKFIRFDQRNPDDEQSAIS